MTLMPQTIALQRLRAYIFFVNETQKVVIPTIAKKLLDAVGNNGEKIRKCFGTADFFFVKLRKLGFDGVSNYGKRRSELRRDPPIRLYPEPRKDRLIISISSPRFRARRSTLWTIT